MSPPHPHPDPASAPVLLRAFSESASAEASPVVTSPPAPPSPPSPPSPADALPLFSLPADTTLPPEPPAPPVLPRARLAPVRESASVVLLTEPRFVTLIRNELAFMFLGVGGGSGPSQGPLRSDVVSQGWNVAFMLTVSPLPGPLPLGPSALPHQLHVASTVLPFSTSTPNVPLPVMALVLIAIPLWLGVPPPFTKSLTTTPSPLPLMMLSVMESASIEATAAAFRVSATTYMPRGTMPLTSLSFTVTPLKFASVPARL